MFPTLTLIAAAGLIAVSTAQAQTGERALLTTVPHSPVAPRFSLLEPVRITGSRGLDLDGARALLGRVQHTTQPAADTEVSDSPVDGARALMGRSISASTSAERSTFVAAIRGSEGGDASGAAEFGLVQDAGSAAPLVLSLGARGDQSAILFTRQSGVPLSVGRYRISDQGEGADEVRALVTTGSVSNPSGAFHGRSGWLVVTEASDHRLTGRFHIDAVGFLAAAPELEDRPLIATGSFSALAAQ